MIVTLGTARVGNLCFLILIQNGECNVRNVERFIFSMSPDEAAFRVRVLLMTKNFEIE